MSLIRRALDDRAKTRCANARCTNGWVIRPGRLPFPCLTCRSQLASQKKRAGSG